MTIIFIAFAALAAALGFAAWCVLPTCKQITEFFDRGDWR